MIFLNVPPSATSRQYLRSIRHLHRGNATPFGQIVRRLGANLATIRFGSFSELAMKKAPARRPRQGGGCKSPVRDRLEGDRFARGGVAFPGRPDPAGDGLSGGGATGGLRHGGCLRRSDLTAADHGLAAQSTLPGHPDLARLRVFENGLHPAASRFHLCLHQALQQSPRSGAFTNDGRISGPEFDATSRSCQSGVNELWQTPVSSFDPVFPMK